MKKYLNRATRRLINYWDFQLHRHWPRQLRFSAFLRKRQGSQGYSLLFVLLIVLAVITTVVSLSSRIAAGQYSESLQGKLRMARNAAENGLTLATSELNKPGNRLLLGRLPINQWATRWDETGQNLWPTRGNYYSMLDYNAYNNLNGDCKRINRSDPNPPQVTEQAVRMATDRSIQIETGLVQSSKIIRFNLYDQDHNLIASSTRAAGLNNTASATQRSFLEITAQGYYNSVTPYTPWWRVDTGSNDYTRSTYKTTRFVLTQEYDVVPRCCGRSFSVNSQFGNDPVEPRADLSCPDGRIVEWYVFGPRRASAYQRP
jgi:hypothetical protein